MTKENKHFIYGLLVLGFMLAFIIWAFSAILGTEAYDDGYWVIYGRKSSQAQESGEIQPIQEEVKGAFVPENGYQNEICSMPYVSCNEPMWRIVTAYNPVEEQCDSDPCIAANGTDICEGLAQGKKYVATNEEINGEMIPFGTKIKIDGEIYEVVDRTNSRYSYRYDIAFPADQIQEANDWGRRILNIEIL